MKKLIFLLIISLPFLIPSEGMSQHSTVEYAVSFGENLKTAVYDNLAPANPQNSFVGISAYCLDESMDISLSYRLFNEGSLTDWIPLNRFTEGFTPGRITFEGRPILENFESIEFRTDVSVDAMVIFRMFYPDPGNNEIEYTRQASLKSDSTCSCKLPEVCYRECWCPSGDCAKNYTATATIPTHVIIHHSAGHSSSNNYANVVAYYWDMHVNTNGWDDIGYNWLIDPNGVIYEGRGDLVQGAHFSCMNRGTVGICMIGNHEEVRPSKAAIDALVEFLGYEMCSKNLEPLSKTYHASSKLRLHTISSHLDGNDSPSDNSCASGTVCPGKFLYELLPEIRIKVANLECLNYTSGTIDSLYESLSKLVIHPNPSNGKFRLTLGCKENAGHFRVDVFDGLGRIVETREGIPSDQDIVFSFFDLYLGAGQYVIRVTTDLEVVSKLLLVN